MLLKISIIPNFFYDNIQNYVNKYANIPDEKQSTYYYTEGIPIKYGDNYYIVAPLGHLELSLVNDSLLSEADSTYLIEFTNYENRGEIKIKKFYSVHELNIDLDTDLDYNSNLRLLGLLEDNICFYDEHIKIMFIKFEYAQIEYIEIPVSDINMLVNYHETNPNVQIEYSGLDGSNNLIHTQITNSLTYTISDKYFNLPPIPYISINNKANYMEDYKKIISGSKVLDHNNMLIGLIYSIEENIIYALPISVITRSFNYLRDYKLPELYIDYSIAELNLTTVTNKQICTQYGLLVKKDYGDNMDPIEMLDNQKSIKNIRKNTVLKPNSIIYSIDSYLFDSNGFVRVENILIPVLTYMWLYKGNNTQLNLEFIPGNNLKNILFDDKILIDDNNIITTLRINSINYNIKYLNSSSTLNINNICFIEYNKKYLLEVNERIILILKDMIEEYPQYEEIFNYMWANRYSKSKIILLIDTEKNDIKPVNHVKDSIKTIKTILTLEPEKIRDYINLI
jgi:hypothetical protein